MSNSLHRLTVALAGRYAIEGELGAGGMATVHLAHDLKHDRKVAVKVLRPDLAAAVGAERFLREIRTTANLRHPHILPLYDSGEADGFLYYVMPLAEGESLRDRLDREKQLPLEDALRIAREVADALSYAHTRDVVHRDIKPENILLESGHAVVTDFGIARAISAAGGERLTETGLAVGTVRYMSPEQASGSTVDGRSDLYSLGCVLYEMLAGQPPFTGATAESVARQHLVAAPPAARTMRSTVPEAVDAALQRALAKTPADRFPSTRAFADALSLSLRGGGIRATGSRRAVRWWGYALILLVVAAIGYGTVRLIHRTPPTPAPPRLVVLPFRNVGAPDDAHFASGITEEITSRLGEIQAISVIARRTALRFQHSDIRLDEIARELGVQYVLEGTVRTDREGGLVRVTPELIHTSSDTHMWTTRYVVRFEPGEIFRIQTEIAEAVAAALNITLSPSERDSLMTGPPTENTVAFEHFLRGNDQLATRSARGVARAIEEYEAAVSLDSDFAPALARIGYAYALYQDWPAWDYLDLPADTMLARGFAAVDRALAQDSSLSDAWMARGYLLMFQHPRTLEGVREAFERAISLSSRNAEALHQYASALSKSGDDSAALAAFHRAIELEPERPITLAQMGIVSHAMRRFDEAVRWFDSATVLDRGLRYAYAHRGFAQLQLGRVADARESAAIARALSQFHTSQDVHAILILADLQSGDTAAAEARVPALVENLSTPVTPSWALIALGRYDEAVDILERHWTSTLLGYARHPEFDPIRSDPRFQGLTNTVSP